MANREQSSTARRTWLRTIGCLLVATTVWLSQAHRFFQPSERELPAATGLTPNARALRQRLVSQWARREELGSVEASWLRALRRQNPEWDLMTRMFIVTGLANAALREDADRSATIVLIDKIIGQTQRDERVHGQAYFLLPYARRGRFKNRAGRSLFVDGEIALMLAARCRLSPLGDETHKHELRRRVRIIEDQMAIGPIGSAESYPDECWTFCNTTALAALRVSDGVLATDHRAFGMAWISSAKRNLLDPSTGLLVSSYSHDGQRIVDGPEGSSIFMSATNLLLVDPEFARDQLTRAHRVLGRAALGFAWASEWPRLRPGSVDIDSGPVVPILDASPGASGFALLGARARGDDDALSGLLASLELAAFPVRRGDELNYQAATPMGDAVVLYALTFGPLWERSLAEAS